MTNVDAAEDSFRRLRVAGDPDRHEEAALWLRRHRLIAPLVGPVENGLADDLVERARLVRADDGTLLFHEGANASHWLIVRSGAVDVFRFGDDGTERMLHRFGAGQMVAEAAMFMPHCRYPMSARTFGVTSAWRCRRDVLRAAVVRHPALGLALLESLSLRVYQRVNEVEWMTTSSAPQRLAAYLLIQAARQGDALELPLTQRQLAALLGMRAETLSRMFADWLGRGWVEGERRRWTIRNRAELEALAQPAARTF